MLRAVLLKGGPRFVKTDLALEYYNDITQFVEDLGVSVTDDPEAIDEADIIIAHGKAVPRLGDTGIKPVVRLGHPDGVCHPRDYDWQCNGQKGIPPDEHLILSADQKLALQEKVEFLKQATTPVVTVESRQSSKRRPGVR
jgi:hypothetical protein